MKNPTVSLEDLQTLRKFLKNKRIPFERLSKEMNYSTSHVIKVFRGSFRVQPKFLTLLLVAVEKILQKDLKDFHELLRGQQWTTFT